METVRRTISIGHFSSGFRSDGCTHHRIKIRTENICGDVAATMTRRRWKVNTSTHASNHYDACEGWERTDSSGESVQTTGSVRWTGFQRINLLAGFLSAGKRPLGPTHDRIYPRINPSG